MSILNGPL